MIQNYLEPWTLVVDQHKSHCVLFIRFELLFQCQRSHLFCSSPLQLYAFFQKFVMKNWQMYVNYIHLLGKTIHLVRRTKLSFYFLVLPFVMDGVLILLELFYQSFLKFRICYSAKSLHCCEYKVCIVLSQSVNCFES